jgi:hypothetical protein
MFSYTDTGLMLSSSNRWLSNEAMVQEYLVNLFLDLILSESVSL